MRRVAWVGVSMFAAAIACGQAAALTEIEPDRERFLLFSGVDLWGNGGFGHAGFLWSPGGLDQEGFTAKVLIGGGIYNYLNGAVETTGRVLLFDAMPGWRFKRGSLEVTAYAGLDIQNHRLSPDDPNNRSRGLHAGARIGGDLWWQPTTESMVSASASFASIGTGYWSRVALGWRAFDLVYVGPEAHAMGDNTYHQWRIGAHATAFKFAGFEWSAGLGYVEDSSNRSGLYGRVGVLTRQ